MSSREEIMMGNWRDSHYSCVVQAEGIPATRIMTHSMHVEAALEERGQHRSIHSALFIAVL